jgi:hypothetical protein
MISTKAPAGAGALAGDLKECAERCSDNDDCLVFGADLGYVCNQSTRRCEGFADPCTDSTECIPDASLWLWACNNDADCFFFTDDVCVDIGGLGFCARMVPYGGCVDPTPDEITLPRYSMSGTVEVCAQTDRQCIDGDCVRGCTLDIECTPNQNGSFCDTNTGRCLCQADADCGGPGVSRCNTQTGVCECSFHSDCAEVPGQDLCYEGTCGCSAVSACTADPVFWGTTDVCE